VDAIRRGDRVALPEHIEQIDEYASRGWKRVFRGIAKLNRVNADMREAWLRIYVARGDHIRIKVEDDLLLIGALRILLPRYRGPAVTLYRGDSFWNRRRRTYGLSWTSEREVAESFANRDWRTCEGGSVLLQTRAPPSAIICAPHLLDKGYGEHEYLVDRRRLGRVTVLQLFSQLSIEEAHPVGEEKGRGAGFGTGLT
jgi:hypothetical protein